MPDRNGYIGRAPSDSSVTVARQSYTASGITTDFTFSSGYTPGYFDIYINGVKMIEGSDYTSSDGSTFSILNGGASDGDALEAVAYKAFNAANVTSAGGDFTVGGNLTVSGSATFSGAGTSVAFATTAFNLSGTPDIAARNITGTGATFTGDVNIGGVLSYEDVQNIDSVGIVTARTGVRITNGGLVVTAGIATLGAGLTMGDNDKAFFGDGGDLEIFHDGTRNYIDSKGSQLRIETDAIRLRTDSGETYLEGDANSGVKIYFDNSKKFETTGAGVTITGVCTATSFEGSGANLTNLPASGDSNDITACLFI